MTLPIVETDALEQLADDVVAYFAASNVRAAVSIGWKERTKQINQGPGGAARVVFQPSDDDGSAGNFDLTNMRAGEVPIFDTTKTPPLQVAHARRLRTWHETIVVNVWAHDDSKPDDERAQRRAAKTLVSWTMRAVQASAAGAANAQWGKATASYGQKGSQSFPTELRNGVEYRLWLELRSPVFDRPVELAYPGQKLNTVPVKE